MASFSVRMIVRSLLASKYNGSDNTVLSTYACQCVMRLGQVGVLLKCDRIFHSYEIFKA